MTNMNQRTTNSNVGGKFVVSETLGIAMLNVAIVHTHGTNDARAHIHRQYACHRMA